MAEPNATSMAPGARRDALRIPCPGFLRGHALPIVVALAGLAAFLPAASKAIPVQLVSAKRYYTLSLAGPAAPGQESRPYVRYQAEWRLVNKGSGSSFEIENDELAYLPYLEYRAWVDGVPLPVQKIGNRYFFRIYLRRRQTATVQVSSLQRVLPIDPARKIDEFEDLIEWHGWMPPIEDYWVVVDLGGIYTAYRQQVPAFGLGGNGPAPGLSFPQFLANRIVQISPGGYQQGAGNKIWWHEQNVWKPQEYFTLRVRWQAWYR